MSTILRIEHPVLDYDMWKNLFDRKGPNFRTWFEARRYRFFLSVARTAGRNRAA